MKDKMKKIIAGLTMGLTICGGSLAMTACTEPKDPPTTETGSGNNNTNTGTNTGTNSGNGDNNTENNQNTGTVTEAMVRNHPVAPATDFEYEQVTGGIKITKYIGTDTIVNIPDTIDGKPVVEFSTLLFANKSIIQGIKIPNSVKSIHSTFGNNLSIQVVICEGIERLEELVFANCPELHTLLLGENLQYIGETSFYLCGKLESLYISPSLTEIFDFYQACFLGCPNLTIQGEAGSYIQTYCTENNIPFEVVER